MGERRAPEDRDVTFKSAMFAGRIYGWSWGRRRSRAGRLQAWLQDRDARWVMAVGNALSSVRYWCWRAKGGPDV